MSIAYAHGGDHVHVVGGVDWLIDWTFDPTFLVPLVVAILYFRGVRRYRAKGGKRFSLLRQSGMAFGLLCTIAGLLSPIDLLAEWSFIFHMVQHELIMSFAVPAILLSEPFLPVVWGLPDWVRRKVFAPFARNPRVQRTFRFFTHPVVGLLTYGVALLAWHVPGIYDAAYRVQNIHYLQHLSFVVGSALFWWGIITPYPFSARLHVFLRIMLVFVSEIPNVALSALITFSDDVLYAYRQLDGFWGLSMLDEQKLGGLLMWVGAGATLRLSAAMIVLIVYAQSEALKEPPRVLYPTRDGAPVVG